MTNAGTPLRRRGQGFAVCRWMTLALAGHLLLVAAGCSSETKGSVVPTADSVPQPSLEPGDVPDPTKLKRVKLD